ncbi:MAG: CAP domain-containing protein [Verrucomicrobiaceae bacterium]
MIRITLLACILTGIATAAPRANDEILSRLQTHLEEGSAIDPVVESLESLSNNELLSLLKEYDKTWPRLRDKYLSTYEEKAEDKYSGSARNEMKKMIEGYRKDFFRVRDMPEGPMKAEIPKVSKPAIEGLRKLLQPKPEELLSTAGPEIQKMRSMVLTLASFRDAIVESAVIPDAEEAVKFITEQEKTIAATLGGLDRDGLKVMKKNDAIAAKVKLPADEREGVREVNEWRMLLGLSALEIDPKLCDASRGHSEDMNKLNFFDHMSPVPGKRTPGDRASAEGTGWSGENIYMGNAAPKAANKGWFYSPGHHKNMFRAGHKKIGMGRYEKHWTQMFG